MHQPHAEPRSSIYYQYQVFDPWLPPAGAVVPSAPVVVVGAGPVGLVTALALAAHGVPVVVLESERQVSEGSRAIAFTRRSMEILQQVGIADRITEMGLPWRFGNSIYRGERVFRMENPHDENDRFSPLINIQQQYLEEFLVDACGAQPLIDLRWGNRVTALQQDADGAVISVDTPAGPYEQRCHWVVAADGARSAIRSLLGLKLEGASYEGKFVIADIRVDLPLPTERLAFFDPVWNPGNTILMHREPHGLWRLDYQLPADETPEQALDPDSLKSRIDAQLAMIGHSGVPWEMDWCSVYSARALTLPDYVCGRTLFVGDAAHLLPIFGVRGANTGFQDAQALAWRLALVAKGAADAGLLATYSQERVGAAREIIDEAGKSTRFMTPPTRGYRLLRDAVLSLSLQHPFVGPLFHWRTSRPHAYSHSSINCRSDDDAKFAQGPGHGLPPANVRLNDDEFLLDHLGHSFTVLLATTANALPEPWLELREKAAAAGWPLRIVALHLDGGSFEVKGADLSLNDPDGRLSERYGLQGESDAYLIRPDQHICGRWRQASPERVMEGLRQATGNIKESVTIQEESNA